MKRWALAALLAVVACKKRKPDEGNEVAVPPPPAFVDPIVVAKDQPGPSAVAVDATHLYWASFGEPIVRRMPRGGGAIETIYEGASDLGATMSIGLDADGVYFHEVFSIKRVPKAGGPATDVGLLDSLPATITADADGAYSITDGAVMRYPRGGTPVRLSGDREIWDVAVDATHVYWIARGGVKRIGKQGGEVEVLAKGTFRFCELALSDTDVYWGDAVLEGVFSVPKAGGPARFVAHAWSIAGKDLAFDRGVLWALQSGGRLERIDPATGDVTTMTTELGSASAADLYMGFAIAGDDVYIANGASHLVGVGPVHYDLGEENPKLPDFTYDGTILRVPMTPAARPLIENRRAAQLAWVWFDPTPPTKMQDPGNAIRWIEEHAGGVVPDVRAGVLGLRLVAYLDGIDEPTGRARAAAVEAAIRAQLGGTPRIAISVAPPAGYRGHVAVDLETADLEAAMKP